MKAIFLLIFLALGGSGLAQPAPGISQHLGDLLPIGQTFRDETGRTVSLAEALGHRPAVLVFNYLRCPELCSVVSEGSVDSLRALQLSAGRDFSVVTISIDPTDTPPMARDWRDRELGRYGRPEAADQWHVLTGSPAAIAAVTQAAGFGYTFDPRSRQYGHASGILIITPTGRISRYLLGVDYPPRELSAALVAASREQIGPPAFELILNCIEGGATGGRYGRLIWAVLSVAVAATVLLVFGGIAALLLQEKRKRRRVAP